MPWPRVSGDSDTVHALTTGEDEVSKSGFYGWKLLAAFWVVLFCVLAFPAYGTSVINAYMAVDLHLDGKMRGLPYSVYGIMSGLPTPLVAMCVNRKGVRFTLILGALLVLIGSLIMALFVSGAISAAVAFGLIVGGGVATGGALPTQTGVTYWFLRRRALALSVLLSGAAVGGFVSARLLNYVIVATGGNWRAGWWVLAGLTALVIALELVVVKERPQDLGQFPDGEPRDAIATSGRNVAGGSRVHVTTEEWTYREVVRSPQLWQMLLGTVGVAAGFALFLAHGVIYLKSLGHSMSDGATAVSLFTISMLVAKTIVAVLGDRLDPRYLWAAFTLVFAAGLLLIVHATGAADIYPFAICLGIGYGGMFVCQMAVLVNYYGVKAYASVVGLVLAIQTVVGSTYPYIAGAVYDVTGTFASSFYFLAAVCLVSAVILFTIRPPVRRLPVNAGRPCCTARTAGRRTGF